MREGGGRRSRGKRDREMGKGKAHGENGARTKRGRKATEPGWNK